MAVVLAKVYEISGNYTDEEKAVYKDLIDDFRLAIADDIPEKNVTIGKVYQYTDNQIVSLLQRALRDLNCGYPKSNKTITEMYKINSNILIMGAIIFSLLREGIFQLRNQIDFNDSGLSISMFNKTTLYQSWYGTLLNQYLQEKQKHRLMKQV